MSGGSPAVAAALLRHPDGSAGLLVASAPPHPPSARALAPEYAAQEAAAQRELQKMLKQDEQALVASRAVAEQDLQRMLSQEGAMLALGLRDCPVYSPPAPPGDEAVRAAVDASDVRSQQVIAEQAAGLDPIMPDPSLLPTPGMDWLSRMRSEDDALRAAIAQSDVPLKPTY
jgi:dihydrodipicolinate synthase/N-acetylneuraminate lyase